MEFECEHSTCIVLTRQIGVGDMERGWGQWIGFLCKSLCIIQLSNFYRPIPYDFVACFGH